MLLKLLGLPLTLPIAGFRFALEQIAELADQELMDESVVHEQILLLQLALEEGEIEEEEYLEREGALMQRLREIRAYKEQLRQQQAGEAGDDDGEHVSRRVVVEMPFEDDEAT
jgi:hypothetical protein